jgi:hypothetical protein
MKNFILLLIVVSAAYFGYISWQKHNSAGAGPVAESAEQSAEPAAAVAAAPNPAAPANPKPDIVITATPQSQQPVLAPKGVYYLLERVSVTTDSGIFSAPVGTKVTEIKTTVTGMAVTDGQHQFNITPSQVTNDMTVASQLANHDRATQARLKADLAQQAKIYQEKETASIKQSAAQSATLQQAAPPQEQAAPIPSTDNLHTTYHKKHAIPLRDIFGKVVGYNWVDE